MIPPSHPGPFLVFWVDVFFVVFCWGAWVTWDGPGNVSEPHHGTPPGRTQRGRGLPPTVVAIFLLTFWLRPCDGCREAVGVLSCGSGGNEGMKWRGKQVAAIKKSGTDGTE